MNMKKPTYDAAPCPDAENLEGTTEDFTEAWLALDAFAEIFGSQAAEAIGRRSDR